MDRAVCQVFTDRVQVCALVFGPVTGVAEGLEAARVLADVRFLPCVASQVDLQVLQTRECLGAALKLKKVEIKKKKLRKIEIKRIVCMYFHMKQDVGSRLHFIMFAL